MYLWYMGKKVKKRGVIMELVKQNQQENIKRKLKTELEGLSKEEVIEKIYGFV